MQAIQHVLKVIKNKEFETSKSHHFEISSDLVEILKPCSELLSLFCHI